MATGRFVWSATAIAAAPIASGSAAGAMSASPNDTSSPGTAAGPTRRAISRSSALASTKAARISGLPGHRLAEPDGAARRPGRVELQPGALREQQHDGRAEQEAPHLIALPEHDLAVGVVPFADAPP